MPIFVFLYLYFDLYVFIMNLLTIAIFIKMFQFSDCLLIIISREGVLALWKGLLTSLLLATNPAINFMVYEALKRNICVLLDNWVTQKLFILILHWMCACFYVLWCVICSSSWHTVVWWRPRIQDHSQTSGSEANTKASKFVLEISSRPLYLRPRPQVLDLDKVKLYSL